MQGFLHCVWSPRMPFSVAEKGGEKKKKKSATPLDGMPQWTMTRLKLSSYAHHLIGTNFKLTASALVIPTKHHQQVLELDQKLSISKQVTPVTPSVGDVTLTYEISLKFRHLLDERITAILVHAYMLHLGSTAVTLYCLVSHSHCWTNYRECRMLQPALCLVLDTANTSHRYFVNSIGFP